MAYGEEEVIQLAVCEYLRQCTDIPFFHCANERSTSPAHGAKLKKLGVTAGVSDLVLPRSNGKQHGLFIELKGPKGKLSFAQYDFLNQMILENYGAFVCRSAAEAILVIKTFYNIPH